MFPGAAQFPHFPFVLVLAVLGAQLVHRATARRLGLDPRELVRFALVLGVFAFVGARLYPLLVASAAQGWVRQPGALLGIALAIPLLRRFAPRGQTLRDALDALVPGCCVALAIVRIDCWIAGCCAGRMTSVPWGISYPARSPSWLHQVIDGRLPADAVFGQPVHPLPLYFMFLALAVAWLTWRRLPRRAFRGEGVLVFLIVHEAGKWGLEFLRDPPAPDLQWTSLVLALGSAGCLALASIARIGASEGVRETLR